MRRLIPALVLFLAGMTASVLEAQEDFKTSISEASQYFEAEEFSKAEPLYSLLLAQFPKNGEYAFKLGVCMMYSESDKKKALTYLKRAKNDPGFKDPLLDYYMGRALQLNYRFDEAIPYFVAFKKAAKKSQIKSFQPDECIAASLHGKYLISSRAELDIFSRKELPIQDYYRSYTSEGMGGKILYKPDDFKTKSDRKHKDRSLVYLPKAGQRVYFSSYGTSETQRDIYYSERNADGRFGTPVLVEGVNSSRDEDFPFLHPNGKRLYFSSKGFNSMGGYDIFVSNWNAAKSTWNAPENLEFPINSPDDDFLFVTDSTDQLATFSTTRMSPLGKVTVLSILNPELKFQKDTLALAEIKENPKALEDYINTIENLALLHVNHDSESVSVSGSKPADRVGSLPQTNVLNKDTLPLSQTPEKKPALESSSMSNADAVQMAQNDLEEIKRNYEDLKQQATDAKAASQSLLKESQEMLGIARQQLTSLQTNPDKKTLKAALDNAQLIFQDALADSLTAMRVVAYATNLESETQLVEQEWKLNMQYVQYLLEAQQKKSNRWLDSLNRVEEALSQLEARHLKKSELINPLEFQQQELPLNRLNETSVQNQAYLNLKYRDTLQPQIPAILANLDSTKVLVQLKSKLQKNETRLEVLLSKTLSSDAELKEALALSQTISGDKKAFNQSILKLLQEQNNLARQVLSQPLIKNSYPNDFEYFEKLLVDQFNVLQRAVSDSLIKIDFQKTLRDAERRFMELNRFISLHSVELIKKDSSLEQGLRAYLQPKIKVQTTLEEISRIDLNANNTKQINSVQVPLSQKKKNSSNSRKRDEGSVKSSPVNAGSPPAKPSDEGALNNSDSSASIVSKSVKQNNAISASPENKTSLNSNSEPAISSTLSAAASLQTSSIAANSNTLALKTDLDSNKNHANPLNFSSDNLAHQSEKPLDLNSRALPADSTAQIKAKQVKINETDLSLNSKQASKKPNNSELKKLRVPKNKVNQKPADTLTADHISSSPENSDTANRNPRKPRRFKKDRAETARAQISSDSLHPGNPVNSSTLSSQRSDTSHFNNPQNSNIPGYASTQKPDSNSYLKKNFSEKDTLAKANLITRSNPNIIPNQDIPAKSKQQGSDNASVTDKNPTVIPNQDISDTAVLRSSENSTLSAGNTQATKTLSPLKMLNGQQNQYGAYSELEFPEGICFRVQLAAVKKPLTTKGFKNIDSVVVLKNQNDWFCYQKGNYLDLNEAKQVRNRVRRSGYPDAYILVYNNGNYTRWAEYAKLQEEPSKPQRFKDGKSKTATAGALEKESSLYYTIQLGVFSPQRQPAFVKNINPIYRDTLGNGNYRYFTVKARSWKKAKSYLDQLQRSGFEDAFIKAIQNGKPVSISKARASEPLEGAETELQIKNLKK